MSIAGESIDPSLQTYAPQPDVTDTAVPHSNPDFNGGGGWGIFNALLGWQNSATYGSVISYNLYWICVMAGFLLLRWQERRGHKASSGSGEVENGAPVLHRKGSGSDQASSQEAAVVDEKVTGHSKATALPEVSPA